MLESNLAYPPSGGHLDVRQLRLAKSHAKSLNQSFVASLEMDCS